MEQAQRILVGLGAEPQYLYLARANRHGLVAGATGTGKTITLQMLAESLSRAGVPVFCADVKGDLAGISQAGGSKPKIEQRAAEMGLADFAYEGAPVLFWDLLGERGHPVRATIAEMGPLLLARLLELNDTQEGVLQIAFKLADDEGLLLLDLKDLRALLNAIAERADEIGQSYGHVSKATIGTIQRRLLALEQQGAEHFFGEPALALADLMLTTPDGRGAVNVLVADRLMQAPRLYATFLLWLLSELFEELPEVGDLDKPKLVLFFDEAHLLFDDAPKALLEKIEQVVRLIRSKGVGIYFVTQNPLDLPASVLGQLGNRVQHALRAFTPAEQKAVRAAAQTFRPNPAFQTEEAITALGVGEALVSTLQPDGTPGIVERARICPPRSRMGAISDEERRRVLGLSPVGARYDQPIDRESAYEMLIGRADGSTPPAEGPVNPWGAAGAPRREASNPWGVAVEQPAQATAPAPPPRPAASRRIGSGSLLRPSAPAQPQAPAGGGGGLGGLVGDILTGGGGRRQGVAEALAKSVVRSVGTQVGNQLVRGILGSLLKR